VNAVAHALVVVCGIAAMAILAATHTIAGDVAVSGIVGFVGYGVGAGAVKATTSTKTPPA
jgi:hypothetical protein